MGRNLERFRDAGGLNERVLLPPTLLARIGNPVLFIWGADDPFGGEDVARAFAAEFSDARLEIFEAAGPAPWIDYPDETAALVTAFLHS